MNIFAGYKHKGWRMRILIKIQPDQAKEENVRVSREFLAYKKYWAAHSGKGKEGTTSLDKNTTSVHKKYTRHGYKYLLYNKNP